MNTGARKAVLVSALIALLAGGTVIATAGPVWAQDAGLQEKFDAAVELWNRGRSAEAAAALKELLATDPSQEAVYDLLRKAEYQVFLEMLTAGGDAELVAKRLLELAQLGEMQKTKDEAAIKALVDKAVRGEDLGIRTQAVRLLVAQHGEYAVPYLFPFLGSNNTDERVYAILALSELSTEAVLPLVEVLQSEDFRIQYNTAAILEKIGDVRALGAVAALAASAENEAVRNAASAAAATLADTAEVSAEDFSPANAYLMLAKRYYKGDASVIRNYLSGYTLWQWKDGALASRDVPKYLYNLELAEESAYDALGVRPESQDARNMLAAVHYAQWAVLDAFSDDMKATDEVKAHIDRVRNVISLTASQGAETQLGALALGLEWNDGGIARGALATLPMVWGTNEVGADSPLVMALDSEDQTVRFAAAIAALEIAPAGRAFPAPEKVIPLAAQAAATGSVRQALLIEPDPEVRAKSLRALEEAGMYAVAEPTGLAGYRRAREVGTFDVIIIRAGADPEMESLAVTIVTDLKRDFRTAAVPILITGNAEQIEAAKTRFTTSVQGYMAADPLDAAAVKEAAAQSMNDDQKRALEISLAACRALAGLKPNRTVFTNYAEAEGALVEVVASGRPDENRLAALAALRNLGSAVSVGAVTDVFTATANSTAVRVAAAGALGGILSATAAPPAVFDALLAGLGDESSEVRDAAGVALGEMSLTPEQQNQVLTSHRVD